MPKTTYTKKKQQNVTVTRSTRIESRMAIISAGGTLQYASRRWCAEQTHGFGRWLLARCRPEAP